MKASVILCANGLIENGPVDGTPGLQEEVMELAAKARQARTGSRGTEPFLAGYVGVASEILSPECQVRQAKAKSVLEQAGFRVEDVDIRALVPEGSLHRFDIIYLCGGVPPHLARELRRFQLLPRLRPDVILVGASAGAMALAGRLSIARLDPDTRRMSGLVSPYGRGLGLVPGWVVPHFPHPHDSPIARLLRRLGAILIPDGKYRVIEEVNIQEDG